MHTDILCNTICIQLRSNYRHVRNHSSAIVYYFKDFKHPECKMRLILICFKNKRRNCGLSTDRLRSKVTVPSSKLLAVSGSWIATWPASVPSLASRLFDLGTFSRFRFQWGLSPSFLPESWTKQSKHPSVVLVKTTHQMMAHVPYEGRAYGPPQHAVAIVAELVHLPIVRNLLFFHGKSHAFSLSIFPEIQCKTCGSQPKTHWPWNPPLLPSPAEHQHRTLGKRWRDGSLQKSSKSMVDPWLIHGWSIIFFAVEMAILVGNCHLPYSNGHLGALAY